MQGFPSIDPSATEPYNPRRHCREPCSIWQDAEKVRQRRSRIVQTLNVPQRVRLGPSLAAALLDGLFEHPAWTVVYRSLLVSGLTPKDFKIVF
jgi:hypothetical protein